MRKMKSDLDLVLKLLVFRVRFLWHDFQSNQDKAFFVLQRYKDPRFVLLQTRACIDEKTKTNFLLIRLERHANGNGS